MSTINIENLNKIYDNGYHAVHDFNLNIKDKEFIILVGPSGCGKSTTLRMIAGLEDISSGKLFIDDKLCNKLSPRERGISMCFQSYALYPTMSVYDNLAFALRIAGYDEDEIEREVDKTAKMLGIETYLGRKPKALSGGQQQRVALGRALIQHSKVFLMDEPLSNLDAIQRVNMRSEIRRIHNEVGSTTIYVTHDQIEAMTMADRIIVMKDGYVQQIGTPKELYFSPRNMFVAGFIGDPQMNFIYGKVEGSDFISEDGVKVSLAGFDESRLAAASKLEKVVLGFRPEACELGKEKSDDHSFEASMLVEVSEMLGDTVNIYGYFGKKNMAIKCTPFEKFEVNKELKFVVDYKNTILFNAKTEEIVFGELSKKIHEKKTSKVKIMQFGEGNFLRAFSDWMIQKMNDSGVYDGHVVVVQPLEMGRVDDLAKQDGLYTLYLQGIKDGKKVREHQVIDVLDDFINPYRDWEKYLKYAESEDLEIVLSNTTEAGITLDPTDIDFTKTPHTFPGKVVALLKHRYEHFHGDKSKGLGFIACELIDNNGDELKKCVLELAKLAKLDDAFIAWVNEACHFTSTLVDRIVPGYPRADIEKITSELGYVDSSIVVGEIFNLWCLKKEAWIEEKFPVNKVGGDVDARYVDDIKPYKQRKVSILNGCHTTIVPVAYLSGIDAVKESVDHPVVGKFARDFVYNEVIPTIDLPHDDMVKFANSVFERYENPFVHHLLMSIALNSISKYRERVLPTVKKYIARENKLPEHALFSLASLIKFYGGKRGEEDIALNDNPEYLEFFKDVYSKGLSSKELVHAVLSNTSFWGEDLTLIPGVEDKVLECYDLISKKGMKEALKKFGE